MPDLDRQWEACNKRASKTGVARCDIREKGGLQLKKIYITNDRVRAEFQPEWGGLFSALQFHHPDKGWVDAFVTEAQKPAAVRKTVGAREYSGRSLECIYL